MKLLVKNGIDDDRHGGIENVEHLVNPCIIQSLSREIVSGPVPELRQHQNHVFKKVKQHKIGISSIAFPPVIEQQSPQQSELSNRIIAASGCLLPLNPTNSHTNMCCCNHVYIVRSITNSQC